MNCKKCGGNLVYIEQNFQEDEYTILENTEKKLAVTFSKVNSEEVKDFFLKCKNCGNIDKKILQNKEINFE